MQTETILPPFSAQTASHAAPYRPPASWQSHATTTPDELRASPETSRDGNGLML